MGIELLDVRENDVPLIEASITYTDGTWQVTRVEWQNFSNRDWLVTIVTPNKAPLSTTLRANRSGQRTNIPNGYVIDGPWGAGYKVELA